MPYKITGTLRQCLVIDELHLPPNTDERYAFSLIKNGILLERKTGILFG
jgi:hypothetical protein